MRTIIFAANSLGYCVQVIDNGEVIHEYAGGNCPTESQADLAPDSSGVISRSQLRRWAKQTAEKMAEELLANRVEYDPDLEVQL